MKRLFEEVANLEFGVVIVWATQPKEPPVHWRKEVPVQVPRPKPLIEVPKRLVVLAVVLKKLVEVALVEVPLIKVRFWKVEEETLKRLEKVPRPTEVKVPPVAVLKKRLVVLALPETKIEVLVAFEVVAF